MSTTPESPTLSKPNQMLKNCWSCRLISGGGLIVSGAYVFHAARKVLKLGGPPSMGTVAQITFAASLAAWGVVILFDPVGKNQRKDYFESRGDRWGGLGIWLGCLPNASLVRFFGYIPLGGDLEADPKPAGKTVPQLAGGHLGIFPGEQEDAAKVREALASCLEAVAPAT